MQISPIVVVWRSHTHERKQREGVGLYHAAEFLQSNQIAELVISTFQIACVSCHASCSTPQNCTRPSAAMSLRKDARVRLAATRAANSLGYTDLKPSQLDVIEGFVQGRDVFAILPTGYGKRLCYACLPYTFDALLHGGERSSIVVIVTPLTAIMKDQVGYTLAS